MRHIFSRRSILSGIVLVAAFSLSGAQCSQVGDRITAPTSGSNGGATGSEGTSGSVSACVQACNDIAKAARDAERDLHKENLIACRDLSGPDRASCTSAENLRHATRMEVIAADMQICKAPCHEQGGGSGGQ